MRRFAVTLLVLCGCWDFDSLTSGQRPDQQFSDLSVQTDMLCAANAATEDCTNGQDDNGDCRADCEDPICAAQEICRGAGLMAYGKVLSACAATDNTVIKELYDTINAGKNLCGKCQCTGTRCTSKISYHNAADCADAALGSTNLPGGAECFAGAPPAMTNRYKLALPTPDCGSGNSGTVAADPAWDNRRQLCRDKAVREDCTTLACVLTAYPERGADLCVALAGEVSCPAPFSNRKVWGQTYVGPTQCTCQCNLPGDATCSQQVLLADNNACMNAGAAKKAADISAEAGKMCSMFPGGGLGPGMVTHISAKLSPNKACTPSGVPGAPSPMLTDKVTLCCYQP